MKINSISVVPEEVGCNMKCKYCIAHLTKRIRRGLKKPGINLPKLEKCFKYAQSFGASTGIITSSGETLLGSWTNIENILWLMKKYFGQIDLHTNGTEILNPPEFGRDFSQMLAPYLTNITITVPHYDSKKNAEHGFYSEYSQGSIGQLLYFYEELFKKLNNLGITIRLSCVVHKDGINCAEEMAKYIDHYAAMGVSQIVFRELWIPTLDKLCPKGTTKKIEWCRKNHIPQRDIDKELINPDYIEIDKELKWYGDQPYEINGVAVSTSTCTQNFTKEVVKSVVYRPDNFLYSDWDTKCWIM